MSGRWSSGGVTHGAVMKGVNLGFALVFDEIPIRGSSIYRGFGSMISCACRTPSNLTRIRFRLDSIEIFWLGKKISCSVSLPDMGKAITQLGPILGRALGRGGGELGRGGLCPGEKKKMVGRLRIRLDKLRKIRNSHLFINFKLI
jgi:hypothetical protein